MPTDRHGRPTTQAQFIERVGVLCDLFECSVTSWHRTRSRNKTVGGSSSSKHLTGWGIDLVPDHNTGYQREKIVTAAKSMGLWVVDETDHVHVQGLAPSGRGPGDRLGGQQA